MAYLSGLVSSKMPESYSTRSSLLDSQQSSLLDGSSGQSEDLTLRNKAAVERRVAWLEEEVTVLQQRLRDVWTSGVGGGLCRGAQEDTRLQKLVARLDADLSEEALARKALEERVGCFEEQLHAFGTDLARTLGEITHRIDKSLFNDRDIRDVLVPEPAPVTEEKLRTLIQRVDQGLLAGAGALKDSLTTTPAQVCKEVRFVAPPQASSTRGHRSAAIPMFPGLATRGASPATVGSAMASTRTRSSEASRRMVSPRDLVRADARTLATSQSMHVGMHGGMSHCSRLPADDRM